MSKDVATPHPASPGPDTLLTIASLGLLAEHIHQPLFAKDRELRYVLANHAFCTLLDYPRTELLGRRHSEVFARGAELEAADSKVFEEEAPTAEAFIFTGLVGDGEERPGTRMPILDAQGHVTHLVCILGREGDKAASPQQLERELERYAQERTNALRAMQDQLLRKERLMVLGQLAAGLAHQIRNPLGAIANAIALARRQISPDQKGVARALEIANEEIWEANRIISDLLDYARIRPAARTDAAIDQLVRDALTVEMLPDRVSIAFDLEPSTVSVDHRQVRDALRNIIRNAREAMEGNGALTFTGRVVGKTYELLIQDSGVGVPEEHRHLLFEPLVSSKPLGIGLGLPTARALIMNQAGSLDCITSEVGACFAVRLPRFAPEEDDNDKDNEC